MAELLKIDCIDVPTERNGCLFFAKRIKYPGVLLTTGDGDTRVAHLRARKMAAQLQAATASGQPILLRYDIQAGHHPSSLPISRQIDELTDVEKFLVWRLHM